MGPCRPMDCGGRSCRCLGVWHPSEGVSGLGGKANKVYVGDWLALIAAGVGTLVTEIVRGMQFTTRSDTPGIS